jgi:hypothetical protein
MQAWPVVALAPVSSVVAAVEAFAKWTDNAAGQPVANRTANTKTGPSVL